MKAEKFSPKDVANRMKAKGLQKLKFYCQMCSKQCRDENGFKCHLTSESHLRQMSFFCENSNNMLDSFSKDFEKVYLEILRRRHGTKRMNANNVYQEVIQDKFHVHMNATKWTHLTDFVGYLGKTGQCKVEETERGWYVTYIEKDPALLARQEAYERRVEGEKIQEKKLAKRMEVQRVEAEKMLDKIGASVNVIASKMEVRELNETVALKINSSFSNEKKKGICGKKRKILHPDNGFDYDSIDEDDVVLDAPISVSKLKKIDPFLEKKSNDKPKGKRWDKKVVQEVDSNDVKVLNSIGCGPESNKTQDHNDEELKEKEKKNNDDKSQVYEKRKKGWIRSGILVRIISEKNGCRKYYERKAFINNVHDEYTAVIEILDSGPERRDGGEIIKVDQDNLETVIPKEGKRVCILNGKRRGRDAELIAIDNKKCRATLKLISNDKILKKVDFNDFSKVA